MGARLPSGWKIIKQHRVPILVVTIILVVAIALIILGYRFDWTGFNGNNKSGKTLWDWMQLLFIPVVLAVAGFLFNHRERKAAELRADNEREIEQQRAKAEQELASDRQREDLLQAYLDRMSELLLKEKLRSSEVDDEVRNVARVRTITVLTQLDARRIGYVFAFLREAGLMSTTSNSNVVSLKDADLHAVKWSQVILTLANLSGAIIFEANLSNADLSEANLSEANLVEADLSGAYLGRADLSRANLLGADLSQALLYEANLSQADLSQANLSKANLKDAMGVTVEELEKQAKSLKGATMPDGSIHE
jgi:uncharacterized protein YjbI with pentapeptide repeats